MSDEKTKTARETTGNADKIFLTWQEHERLCQILAEKIPAGRYDSLFPVIRGGVYPAVELSKRLGLPVVWEPRKKSLVVDDICDSGLTVSKFHAAGYDTATVHFKGRSAAPTYYAQIDPAWIVYPWESDKDIHSIVTRQIEYVGDDPNREGLLATPKNAVESWSELFRGYRADPDEILTPKRTGQGADVLPRVVTNSFEFYSTCERSTLPFFGVLTIGLLTDSETVDAAELASLVDCVSRRFQAQERICAQLADAIVNAWNPRGVCVKAVATHSRLVADGADRHEATLVCVARRGDCDLINAAIS